jgi:hypothetical protein
VLFYSELIFDKCDSLAQISFAEWLSGAQIRDISAFFSGGIKFDRRE